MRRKGACVRLGGAASPHIAIEVTFVVDWAHVSGSRVGACVIVALNYQIRHLRNFIAILHSSVYQKFLSFELVGNFLIVVI